MDTGKHLNRFKDQIKDKDSFDRYRRKVSGKLDDMNRGPVTKIWDQVLMLWNYVCDTKTPWTTKILPLAGLVYLISPLDAVPDILFPVGLLDDVAIILFIAEQIKITIRYITDASLDVASAHIRRKGEESLAKLNARAYKDFIISAALNGVMLLCAVLSMIFLRRRNGIGILATALINYVILGRALFSVVRFFYTILIPYHRLISFVLPVFFNGLGILNSFKLAIQVTIVAVVDCFYHEKIPPAFKIVHQIASDFALIKNRDEIKDMAAADFYPLVCRFLRVVFVYNVLLFTVCYGLLIFVVKRFVIETMLNINFVDLYTYPFVYITGLIGK